MIIKSTQKMTGNERKENIEQEKQIESKHYDGRY